MTNVQNLYFKNLQGPFAVVGLGLSGMAVLSLLKSLNVPDSEVLSFDEKSPKANYQNPTELMKRKPRTLFVSPGVPLNTPWILSAKADGVMISSELSLAFSFLSSEKVIGITGSIGKSTITSLLRAGVESFSPNSFVGGNLGLPLADYARELITGQRPIAPWVILEISSYQLENFENLKCEFSAISYLTPNHLERYESLEDYYQVKLSLLKKTHGACVGNNRGGDLRKFAGSLGLLWVDRDSDLMKRSYLLPCQLLGDYNLDNLAVAAKIAELANWPNEAFVGMKNFGGLPHRLENLGKRSGVNFVNDSKATTIESVLQAVETISKTTNEDAKLYVLLGGHDKNLPWGKLSPLNAIANLKPIFFGEFGESARKISGLKGPYFEKLALALKVLPSIVSSGDQVLLSPGGTSHDEFKNFEDRGLFFRTEIEKLFPL